MNTTDYPKCRTCRHYVPWSPKASYGHCPRLESREGSDEFSVLSSRSQDSEVEVNHDKFGCVLHEPTTEETP